MFEPLLEQQRRDVFRTLVELQDQGWTANESRRQIADQYSLAATDMDALEQEGISKRWPPL